MMIAPLMVISIYAPESTALNPYFDLITRAYGSLIFAVGIALFSAIKATESYGRRAVLMLITVANTLVFIMHIYATLKGIENANGWILVIILGVLAIWGGKLLMEEKV